MTKILLTGATGLFGRYFTESNPSPSKFEIVCTSRRTTMDVLADGVVAHVTLPFTDREGYRALLDRARPDVIVHAGAEGSVDEVERAPLDAMDTNLAFPQFLMEEANRRQARLIHFSSNAVYGGEHAPYDENAELDPVNQYGRFKRAVDEAMRAELHRWTLVRPIVAYGWNYSSGRANPVTHFLPRLMRSEVTPLVVDQQENPVYAGDVAEVLWRVITRGYCGEVNVAGGDSSLSRHEWIRRAAVAFSIPTESLREARVRDFSALARRPRDTSFVTERLTRDLGIVPRTVAEGSRLMCDDVARRHFGANGPD